MLQVANDRSRETQLLRLRAQSVEQVHQTALVRYLRDHSVTGSNRNQVLSHFYGVLDPQVAALTEHKNYLISAASQICALDILEAANDVRGLKMIRNYEVTYGQFFSLFCARSRAQNQGKSYVLEGLIPEVKESAVRMRLSILHGDLLPTRRIYQSSSSGAQT